MSAKYFVAKYSWYATQLYIYYYHIRFDLQSNGKENKMKRLEISISAIRIQIHSHNISQPQPQPLPQLQYLKHLFALHSICQLIELYQMANILCSAEVSTIPIFSVRSRSSSKNLWFVRSCSLVKKFYRTRTSRVEYEILRTWAFTFQSMGQLNLFPLKNKIKIEFFA